MLQPKFDLTRRFAVVALAMAHSACAPSSESDPDAAPADATQDVGVSNDDSAILGKVYSTAVSVPSSFYADPTSTLTSSFTLRHLRGTDIGSGDEFELCSDDMTRAVEWSDAVSSPWPVLTIMETDAYYEITRQRTDLPDWLALQRVFKCEFLDRRTADLSQTAGPAGWVNAADPNADTVRFVAEYLWQFSQWSNPGGAVLSSSTQVVENGWRHTLELARRVEGAGRAAGCDRIDVASWQHQLLINGELTQSLTVSRSFDARDDAGVVLRCDAD